MQIEWWLKIAATVIISVSCFYTLVVILRKPETRTNLFLLSITGFHALLAVTASYTKDPIWSNKFANNSMAFTFLMGNWIFQILLLKTALVIPIIFNEKQDNEETYDKMEAEQSRKARKVDYAVIILLILPLL